MNNDSQFEDRLRQESLKPIPGEWRNDILRQATRAAKLQNASTAGPVSIFELLKSRLAILLWPAPRAWAGMAAVWVAILMMNLAAADTTTTAAMAVPLPSAETLRVLKQQQRLLAELVERPEPLKVDRQRAIPSAPRSQRRAEVVAA
jgi:hypothetical protein